MRRRRPSLRDVSNLMLAGFEEKLLRTRSPNPATMDMKLHIWSRLLGLDLPLGRSLKGEEAESAALDVLETALPIVEQYVKRGVLSRGEAERALAEMMNHIPSIFNGKPLTDFFPSSIDPTAPTASSRAS